MRITRIYSDEEGESYFDHQEIELSQVDFAPPAPPLNVSSPFPAAQMLLIEIPASWYGDWHPTPRRQYWVGVAGSIDVTVSSGETRRFGQGSVVLLEDLTGKGHLTREVSGEPAQGLFVQV